MQRHTHVIGGITVGIVLARLLPLPWYQALAGIAIAAVCGFLPDQIQWSSRHVDIPYFEGHRGFSHTLIFALAAGALLACFHPAAGIFCFVGLCSHYLLDLPSDVGIPLWYPMVKRRIAWGIFNNGGRGEFITGALLVMTSIVAIVFH